MPSIYLEVEPPEARKVAGGAPAAIPTEFDVEVNGEPFEVKVTPTGGFIVAGGDGAAAPAPGGKPKTCEGGLNSPMQGNLWKITVKEGDKVKEGQVVAILEVMKMEQDIHAASDGEVKEIFAKEGDAVKKNELLMQIL